METIVYEKQRRLPPGNKLKFYRQEDGQIISEIITVRLNIKLTQLAQGVIERVILKFSMLYKMIYEFDSYGGEYDFGFNNVSEDFTTEINLRIKVLDIDALPDTKVKFKVTVSDNHFSLFPQGGSFGYYSWTPDLPETNSLINRSPSI